MIERDESVLVSVVLPCYNAEEYVEEAVLSILNQSYRNLEIILVDDCSTDNTLSYLKKYACEDNRITIIENKENIGLISTLNLAFGHANGKYISRMDADDISMVNRIERQVYFLENNPEIIICGGNIITFDGKKKPRKRRYPVAADDIRAELVFNTAFAHPAVTIRADVWKKNNVSYNDEYKYAEDFELWQRFLMLGDGFNLPEFILRYRVLSSSQTGIAQQDSETRKATIIKIQNLGLKKIGIFNSTAEKDFHYILSLTDHIRNIDFNKYPVKFILSYFEKLYAGFAETDYCNDPGSYKKVLGKKFLKIIIYNIKKMTINDLLSLALTRYLLWGFKFLISSISNK